MEKKTKKDILFDYNFKKPKITKQTIEYIKTHPRFFRNCDVRTRMGLIYTDEEYEKRRERVLNTPLPGTKKKTRILKRKGR